MSAGWSILTTLVEKEVARQLGAVAHAIIDKSPVPQQPQPEAFRKIKRTAYMKQWTIESKGGKWARLMGRVFDHPSFADGSLIETSPILKLDIPGHSCETMNTIYELEDERVR